MSRRRQLHRGSPNTAIAYLRVSTEDQVNGLAAQRDAIERWAAARGVRLAAWAVDEGVSGATPIDARPGALEALAALSEHDAGLLVAAKRDRLARDVTAAATIEQLASDRGAQVVTADGTDSSDSPEGQLLRTLLDAMAAYERALIRARTKAALRAKQVRGERVGAYAYGLDRAGQPLEHEQAALQRMRELRAGGKTQKQIAAALTSEGFSPRGSQWNVTTVARALARVD